MENWPKLPNGFSSWWRRATVAALAVYPAMVLVTWVFDLWT